MTRPRPGIQPRVALLVCLLFTGCALIDQTTFAPAPEAKPPAPVVQAIPPLKVDPRTPLAVIDFATADPDYQGVLRYAVRAAESRDRAVQYDVIAVAPSIDQATSGQIQAAGVMRSMVAERVAAARIHLGLQTDPSLTANQVRVYVR